MKNSGRLRCSSDLAVALKTRYTRPTGKGIVGLDTLKDELDCGLHQTVPDYFSTQVIDAIPLSITFGVTKFFLLHNDGSGYFCERRII